MCPFRILRARSLAKGVYQAGKLSTHAEFLPDERIAECFDGGDCDHLADYLETAGRAKESAKDFHEFYRARLVATKHGSGSGGGSASSSKGGRAAPIKWPCEISAGFAKDLMPWSAKNVQKDTFNNRWIAFSLVNGRKPFSRSWTLYGPKESLRLVCAQMWNWHTRATGEPCPWADIETPEA